MSWMLLVAAASAQTQNGVENNPDYAVYMRAIDGLGSMTTPRKEIPQILPGTMGFVGPATGGAHLGEQGSITRVPSPPHYIEALVLYDLDHLETINEYGFTLGFLDDIEDSLDGLNGRLGELDDDDDMNGAVAYWVASMTVTNKTTPLGAQIAAVPEFEDDDYEFFTFEVKVNNVVVGWMVREHFTYAIGDAWRDGWYCTSAFKGVKWGNPNVTVTPWNDYDTTAEFFGDIPMNQVAWYQVTNLYKYQALSPLIP